jgi:hypothetical protein
MDVSIDGAGTNALTMEQRKNATNHYIICKLIASILTN